MIALFPSYAGSPTRNPGFLTSFNARSLPAGPHLVSDQGHGDRKLADLRSGHGLGDRRRRHARTRRPSAASSLRAGLPGRSTAPSRSRGWAMDDSGTIDHIDFLVDGKVVAGAVGDGLPSTAIYGLPRPDVFALLPGRPQLSQLRVPGQHRHDGLRGRHPRHFRPGLRRRRLLQRHRHADRPDHQQRREPAALRVPGRPAGQGLDPLRPDYPFVRRPPTCPQPCFPPGRRRRRCPPPSTRTSSSGWALDVGLRAPDQGRSSYVELLLDGAIIANTRRDCVRSGNILANCYGVNRPDVAQRLSRLRQRRQLGIPLHCSRCCRIPSDGLFDIVDPGAFGIPARRAVSRRPASTRSTIRAGDDEETVTQFAAISVDVLCDTRTVLGPACLRLHRLAVATPVRQGSLSFSGWAFDYDNGGQAPGSTGSRGIDIDIDGQVVGAFPRRSARAPTSPPTTSAFPPRPSRRRRSPSSDGRSPSTRRNSPTRSTTSSSTPGTLPTRRPGAHPSGARWAAGSSSSSTTTDP